MAWVGVAVILFAGWAGAAVIDVTAPGNPIVGLINTDPAGGNVLAVSGTNFSASETPANLIDNTTAKHYNNGSNITGTNTDGFVVTPTAPSVVTAISFATGNDANGRDPLTFVIQGSNDANALAAGNSSFTTIFSGNTGLATDPGRNATGPDVTFANATPYSSYRVLFTSTRPAGTGVTFPGTGYQLSEVAIGVPEPASLGLLGLGSLGLLARRRGR